MAVAANTSETYDNNLIREDLQEAYNMISPEATPFTAAIRQDTADSTLFDWPVVELAAVDSDNRVVEGDDAPNLDAPTLGLRFSTYTQISDKTAKVSHSAQAVNAAAENVQRLDKQVALRMKEIKRDKETMLLSNTVSAPASSGNARSTAGLAAWLFTNTSFGTGGADPALSGTTEGYPDTAATAGTAALYDEDDLNDILEAIWNEGGEPSLVMCNAGNKRRISQTFVGNASRYKDSTDKTVPNAIDFYDSDFGMMTIMPNRFQPTNNPGGANDSYNVFVIDPQYAAVAYLETVQRKPLAETGHATSELVWCEYGLQIDNEKAHGVSRDTSNAIS